MEYKTRHLHLFKFCHPTLNDSVYIDIYVSLDYNLTEILEYLIGKKYTILEDRLIHSALASSSTSEIPCIKITFTDSIGKDSKDAFEELKTYNL